MRNPKPDLFGIPDNRLNAVFFMCRKRKLSDSGDVKNLGVTFTGLMVILEL
jgi:hypothetical protein